MVYGLLKELTLFTCYIQRTDPRYKGGRYTSAGGTAQEALGILYQHRSVFNCSIVLIVDPKLLCCYQTVW